MKAILLFRGVVAELIYPKLLSLLMKKNNCLFIILANVLLTVFTCSADDSALNGIVATVNGEPFTLRDLNKRLSPPRKLTMQQAATDPEAKIALDQLILEKLIEEEAKLRRVVVSAEEVERYLNELAVRNELSREEFEKVFKKQSGKTIETFKKEVAAQILKSKLAGELIRDSSAVTDREIDEYIKDHPELVHNGGKIKLSQIMLSGKDEATRKKAEELRATLAESGDFAEAARKFSSSPEAASGGSLGVVAEKDLAPAVFDAVFSLRIGEVSEVVSSAEGHHIFKVEDRVSDNEDDQKRLRTEVDQILKQKKLEARLQDYFNVDLFTNHFVDKKI
ncbi:MAG: peptidylprolyl isomerase [Bdellovibrionota bacterium]